MNRVGSKSETDKFFFRFGGYSIKVGGQGIHDIFIIGEFLVARILLCRKQLFQKYQIVLTNYTISSLSTHHFLELLP